MSIFSSKSNGTVSVAKFDDMIEQFGVVTVMNARVYTKPLYKISSATTDAIIDATSLETYKAHDIVKALLANSNYFTIDTLKIANINMEGPTKTVTGGQYTNPLIKFGKTATVEMQDALGRAEALEVLGGALIEDFSDDSTAHGLSEGNYKVVHIGQDFAGAKTILGESFFIDRVTGAQVKVYIVLYSLLPDSIFNLTQDAEGDATVFDLNGTLSAVDILVGDATPGVDGIVKGVFYSVLPQIDYEGVTPPTTYTLSYAAVDNADEFAVGYVTAKGTEAHEEGDSITLDSVTDYAWYADDSGTELQDSPFEMPAADKTVYLKING